MHLICLAQLPRSQKETRSCFYTLGFFWKWGGNVLSKSLHFFVNPWILLWCRLSRQAVTKYFLVVAGHICVLIIKTPNIVMLDKGWGGTRTAKKRVSDAGFKILQTWNLRKAIISEVHTGKIRIWEEKGELRSDSINL